MNRLLTCATALLATGLIGFAGDITPPGPPGSHEAAMPSLREVEPRTLIDELPYTSQ